MNIDTKALPIWGWIAHHRESGGRPIIADPGRAAMLPRTEGWDVFPVCRVDDAADRIAALEEQLHLTNVDALQAEAERNELASELRQAMDERDAAQAEARELQRRVVELEQQLASAQAEIECEERRFSEQQDLLHSVIQERDAAQAEVRGMVDEAVVRRVIAELRTYNPAADEYKGAHIHKVWARELAAALAPSARSRHMTTETDLLPQPAEPVKCKRRYAQGTALGEFGILPMCDQVDDETVKVPSDDLAHEIWAAAQTAAGEGIEDAVIRITRAIAPLQAEVEELRAEVGRLRTMSEKHVTPIKTLARYEPDTVYIGTGEYVAECVRADDGDYYLAADVDAAIEALRAEVAEWKRVASAQAELHDEDEECAERLAEALRGWWKAHRPVGWTEDQHRSCPHVNLATDAEKALATALLRYQEE